MFLVIELQTDAQGQTANIVTGHADYHEAESKFHQILSSAAISSVPCHSAVIIDETGAALRNESYRHDVTGA